MLEWKGDESNTFYFERCPDSTDCFRTVNFNSEQECVCKLRVIFLQRQGIVHPCQRPEISATPTEALAVGDSAHIYDSWRERDMQIVVCRAHTNRDHLNRGPLSYNGTPTSSWTLDPCYLHIQKTSEPELDKCLWPRNL